MKIEKAIDLINNISTIDKETDETLNLAIAALKKISEERIVNDIEYQRGFRDGFVEGQSKGLQIATNALATQVKPIVIYCENEEMAKKMIENLGGKDV